ncbi:hypothetical protein PUN28_005479 [Cardiocondyla obscurior]|uniref:Uncharacterized protein n=1 Tax=Cardiocondyla obscurior TaxID=286306 RepID=A0AAW2GHR8_9HYME
MSKARKYLFEFLPSIKIPRHHRQQFGHDSPRYIHGTIHAYAPTSYRQYIYRRNIYIYIHIYIIYFILYQDIVVDKFVLFVLFVSFWRTFLRTVTREIRIVFRRKRAHADTRTRLHSNTHTDTHVYTDYQ